VLRARRKLHAAELGLRALVFKSSLVNELLRPDPHHWHPRARRFTCVYGRFYKVSSNANCWRPGAVPLSARRRGPSSFANFGPRKECSVRRWAARGEHRVAAPLSGLYSR